MREKHTGILVLCILTTLGCDGSERPLTGISDAGTDSNTSSELPDNESVDSTDDLGPCNSSSTNQGCEFWAVDLPNVSVAPLLMAPHLQQFAVVVANTSANVPANVSVYSGDGSTAIESATVQIDDVYTFALPSQNIEPGATTINGVAFRIESDVPITAYQFNPLDNTSEVYSNDASLLFPSHVLSGDYTAITGSANLVQADGFSMSPKNTGGFVSVVATEDETTVSIYPTQPLHPGQHQDVVLSRGQVLTAIASGAGVSGNLSGTRVSADKKVAVFSGSVATSEPTNTTKCCADHVEHQMLPLEAWGSTYAVSPAVSANGNADNKSLYRISGAFDDTSLVYSPAAPEGAPSTINAYETIELLTKEPFIVSSNNPNKPFSVTQFLLSNQFFKPAIGSSVPGDPSMIVLPAKDQFQQEYIFIVPKGYSKNYVTIVRPTDAEVLLNGQTVTTPFSPMGEHSGTNFEYAHVALQVGHQSILAKKPIAITVIGYSSDVSYGYPGGSGVSQISAIPPI